MLLTFKDRGVDNDVPFVSFQKKYRDLIMSQVSLKGRKWRACTFANHSLIKNKLSRNVLSIKCDPPPIELKYLHW